MNHTDEPIEPNQIRNVPLNEVLGKNQRIRPTDSYQRGTDIRSGNLNVRDINGNTLTAGLLPGSRLGLQITNSDGAIVFDALGVASATVSPQSTTGVSSFISIQTAVNAVSAAGGGLVFMHNGTYLLDTDITIPSNVTLQGETGTGVVLDFQNGAFQIKSTGTLIYSTGTVAINNNSTIVTGTGTAFTSSMTGQSILLKGRWFTIAGVFSTTQLNISQPFDADSITGYGTVIATIVSGITLQDFTVQNSTHANGAVYFAYAQACTLDNITALTSTIGHNYLATNNQDARNYFVGGCVTGVQVSNSAVWTMYNFEIYGSTGVNLLCNSFYNTSVANATLSSAIGNNATLTSCEAWGFYDMENTTAGGKGIEMISCKDIEISNMTIRDATSDGIKLTSGCSRISMGTGIVLLNNGGYGVNIAAASDDRNTILGCFFSGNTTGTVNNAGTNTINANNQT